jgi:ureidoglycolate lyase
MRELTPVPLTPAGYAPFGAVIAARLDEPGRSANQGRARVYDRLVTLVNDRSDRASANLSVFHSAPWPDRVVRTELLEKHPRSTQVFVPMNATRYLVVVALGGDRPDLATLTAFLATGDQGIAYHPGVWHHPMIALDRPTDFTVLVWEDGTADDCVLVRLEAGEQAVVRIP